MAHANSITLADHARPAEDAEIAEEEEVLLVAHAVDHNAVTLLIETLQTSPVVSTSKVYATKVATAPSTILLVKDKEMPHLPKAMRRKKKATPLETILPQITQKNQTKRREKVFARDGSKPSGRCRDNCMPLREDCSRS